MIITNAKLIRSKCQIINNRPVFVIYIPYSPENIIGIKKMSSGFSITEDVDCELSLEFGIIPKDNYNKIIETGINYILDYDNWKNINDDYFNLIKVLETFFNKISE